MDLLSLLYAYILFEGILEIRDGLVGLAFFYAVADAVPEVSLEDDKADAMQG